MNQLRFTAIQVEDVTGRDSVHTRVNRDPVNFPRLAAVFREGLLKSARIRRNVRYHEPDKDGAAVQCLLIKKLASSLVKPPD